MLAQDLGPEGVEGADGDALSRAGPASWTTRSFISAAALLVKVTARMARAGTPLVKQVGDAVGDDPRLARARPGEHQQRPLGGGDGLALRGVQSGEVHAGRTRIGWGADRWPPPPRALQPVRRPHAEIDAQAEGGPGRRRRASVAASSSTSSPRWASAFAADPGNPGSYACKDCERCANCMFCRDCVGCYQCTHCVRLRRVQQLQPLRREQGAASPRPTCVQSENCTHSAYLVMCRNLSDCNYCFGCVGSRKKDFHILNVAFPRKDYFESPRGCGRSSGCRRETFSLPLASRPASVLGAASPAEGDVDGACLGRGDHAHLADVVLRRAHRLQPSPAGAVAEPLAAAVPGALGRGGPRPR